MAATPRYPVLWQPNSHVIGYASTRTGALRHAARIPGRLACERTSATLAMQIDEWGYEIGLAWFTSFVLRSRGT